MNDIGCSPIPWLDPVIFDLPGPIDLRWYALAYIAGLVLGWRYFVHLAGRPSLWTAKPNPAAKDAPMTKADVDEFLFFGALGVILGGRLGYVLFYKPEWIWTNPVEILLTWNGGMSFHGGLLGVTIALLWASRVRKTPFLRVIDGAAAVTPIGLFFGRLANFINGELYGRPWDGPWAMRFPCDRLANPNVGIEGPLRHPSQLYEAALEGLVLFVVLLVATRRFGALRRPGMTTGLFLIGYGVFRSFVENFREPDVGLENLPFGLTMGMILSTPMWLAGAFLVWRALSKTPIGTAKAA